MHHKVLEYLDKIKDVDLATCIDWNKLSEEYIKAGGTLQPEIDFDKVNHPKHYNSTSIETIDLIKGAMSQYQFHGYLQGNIIKYICRYREKNGLEDLEKSRWYLNKLIEDIKA